MFKLIIAIFAVVALIGLVASTVNIGGGLKTQATANDVTLAAMVIQQAGEHTAGIAVMMANGSDIADITLDKAGTTGLYGADGGMNVPDSPVQAQTVPTAWAIAAQKLGGGQSITALGLDYVVYVPVTAAVCRAITKAKTKVAGLPAYADATQLTAANGADLTATSFDTAIGCKADDTNGVYHAYAVVQGN